MAHNIGTQADGKAGMVFTGTTPWHGLGTKFDKMMTTLEALKGAGFPDMVEIPACYSFEGNTFNVPDKKVIVRKDNGSYVSTVGDGYKVIQYSEAFKDMGDGLIGEGGAFVETAGFLGNGAKGWMMMNLPGDIEVEGTAGDTIKRNLLISTAHDGTANLSVRMTAIRVVCQNTLNAAIKADKADVSIRHSKNADIKMSKAAQTLAEANSYYAKFADSVNLFASKTVNPEFVKAFLNTLIPDKADAKHKTRSENIRAEIAALADHGVGQDIAGVKGTLWALYNGVTEYTDYARGTRGDSDASRAENRLDSVFFGTGADLKEKAFDLALAMA